MLIKNRVTSFLYEHGYNGVDNIYDYWIENKNSIIDDFCIRSKIVNCEEELQIFSKKIRWSSNLGLFLRLSIEKCIRKSVGNDLPLENIKVRIGTGFIDISQFSLKTMDNRNEGLIDLRGISLLAKQFDRMVITNVDFSNGTLDDCIFSNVKFVNCRFNRTSFNRCRMIHVSFNEDCVFANNDFRDAYIDGIFRCKIENPTIAYIRFGDKLYLKKAMKESYLKFTIVISDSFVDRCTNSRIRDYLEALKIKINI